jgi:peroxiredoxin
VTSRLQSLVAASLGICFFIGSFSAGAKDMTGEERAEVAHQSLVGSLAPKLTLKTIDGQVIDLGKLYGKKAVYLKFWATWCVPCRQQMPHFEHIYETAGPDLAVIAVDIGLNDPLENVKKFRRESAIRMPIVIDEGSLVEAFHVRVTPQHVVIGRDGRVLYIGHLADRRLEDALVSARLRPGTADSQLKLTGMQVQTRHYQVGDRLPALSAKTLEGQIVRLGQPYTNGPTVLVFMDAFCEWYLRASRPDTSNQCRVVREQVAELAKENLQSPQVRWIGIASGIWTTEDDLKGYVDKYKPGIPLALDDSGALFRAFGIESVPTLLIIDTHGKIVRRVEGPDANLAAALQRIASQ